MRTDLRPARGAKAAAYRLFVPGLRARTAHGRRFTCKREAHSKLKTPLPKTPLYCGRVIVLGLLSSSASGSAAGA
jgi:hypothetical protein